MVAWSRRPGNFLDQRRVGDGVQMNRQGIYRQCCVISDDAQIGDDTRIGNFVFIRENTIIGQSCTIGSFVDIEGDVRIGDLVSLQSGCYLTRGVVIESEVFCGPRIVTMNDKRISYRRALLSLDRRAPRILRAARVGGGCVLCPGVTIDENALVGAGSVVTRDVPDRTIVAGKSRPPHGHGAGGRNHLNVQRRAPGTAETRSLRRSVGVGSGCCCSDFRPAEKTKAA